MCVCVCVSGETGMYLQGELCVSESVGIEVGCGGREGGVWRKKQLGFLCT